jgi:hypothetical protein
MLKSSLFVIIIICAVALFVQSRCRLFASRQRSMKWPQSWALSRINLLAIGRCQ